MVSPNQLAIQSHPKHLEKLFELLKIKRSLMPKKTPGHPLLDEPDNSKELDAQYAKIYKSCIGLLVFFCISPETTSNVNTAFVRCRSQCRSLQ